MDMSVEVTTLPNGLRVVTDPMPQLESAAVGVWVDAGGRHETAELNGVAHMLEHMAFKGTERRSAIRIAEEIEAVGGHLNAYTSREQTAYFVRVLKDDVALGVDLLADIVQHSVFDEEELARERTVIEQEIGQAEDTPDDIIFDHLQAAAFPDQPVGWPILGSVERVRGFTSADLRRFLGLHYHGPRTVLVASGAVTHDAMVRLAEQAFPALENKGGQPLVPAAYAGGPHYEERDLEQLHFALAFPGVPYDDADFYAVQVMATALGGGMSSRLFQEVRERRGLCYSVFAYASSFVDGGIVTIYAGTGPEQADELVSTIVTETLRLADDAAEAEVARARAQLKAGLLMSLESPSARSEQLARQMMIHGRPMSRDEIVEKVEAVDAAAVRRAVARVIGSGAPTVAALGPLDGLASYDRIASSFA